ncbi:hypothetical protein [Halobaculum lipolyticum]|uniref:DUF7993 domain-containing protein n=1 Tax=Halobaculum lipolyticum TaxID=3032001 RepID=A0ABD5WBW3_9EURY|nr:hypothetical protein [Halobaculum sp. DT31]
MVAERTTDGVRIAQLLASELVGDRDRLRDVSVGDADPDVDASPDGTLAYRVRRSSDPDDGDPTAVAEVFVHPDRARVEFLAAPDAAATAASAAGLRVRPKAVTPPRTVVFVADGAQVKRVLSAFVAAVGEDGGD